MRKASKACREAFRKICSGSGRDLDSPECRSIRAHIRRCGDCTSLLKEIDATVDLYRRYPVPPHQKIGLK